MGLTYSKHIALKFLRRKAGAHGSLVFLMGGNQFEGNKKEKVI